MTTQPLAIAVAAVAAFLASGIWYSTLGARLAPVAPARLNGPPPPARTAAVELARNGVLAVVAAVLVGGLGIESWVGGLGLGLLRWVGFPAVLLSGSVYHEGVPWRRAAAHVVDWLIKLTIIAVLVTVWQR